MEVGSGCARKLFQGNPPDPSDFFGDMPHQGRMIKLAAMWDRRKIRGIGFHQETVKRYLAGNVMDLKCLFESDNA
jgi:hypothetical protein